MILSISSFALAQEFKRIEFISFTSMVLYSLGTLTALSASSLLSVNASEDGKTQRTPIFILLGMLLSLGSLVIRFIALGEAGKSSHYSFLVIFAAAFLLTNISSLAPVKW